MGFTAPLLQHVFLGSLRTCPRFYTLLRIRPRRQNVETRLMSIRLKKLKYILREE